MWASCGWTTPASMDVDGEGNPVTRYTATASYTGTTSSRYATGYTVSASYTGEVSKANCAVVTYTAIFGSEKAPEESKAPDGDEQHDSDSGQTEAPDTANRVTLYTCVMDQPEYRWKVTAIQQG